MGEREDWSLFCHAISSAWTSQNGYIQVLDIQVLEILKDRKNKQNIPTPSPLFKQNIKKEKTSV
jgi:hypothetical protein